MNPVARKQAIKFLAEDAPDHVRMYVDEVRQAAQTRMQMYDVLRRESRAVTRDLNQTANELDSIKGFVRCLLLEAVKRGLKIAPGASVEESLIQFVREHGEECTMDPDQQEVIDKAFLGANQDDDDETTDDLSDNDDDLDAEDDESDDDED